MWLLVGPACTHSRFFVLFFLLFFSSFRILFVSFVLGARCGYEAGAAGRSGEVFDEFFLWKSVKISLTCASSTLLSCLVNGVPSVFCLVFFFMTYVYNRSEGSITWHPWEKGPQGEVDAQGWLDKESGAIQVKNKTNETAPRMSVEKLMWSTVSRSPPRRYVNTCERSRRKKKRISLRFIHHQHVYLYASWSINE